MAPPFEIQDRSTDLGIELIVALKSSHARLIPSLPLSNLELAQAQLRVQQQRGEEDGISEFQPCSHHSQ
jgi:hypothetical protein